LTNPISIGCLGEKDHSQKEGGGPSQQTWENHLNGRSGEKMGGGKKHKNRKLEKSPKHHGGNSPKTWTERGGEKRGILVGAG